MEKKKIDKLIHSAVYLSSCQQSFETWNHPFLFWNRFFCDNLNFKIENLFCDKRGWIFSKHFIRREIQFVREDKWEKQLTTLRQHLSYLMLVQAHFHFGCAFDFFSHIKSGQHYPKCWLPWIVSHFSLACHGLTSGVFMRTFPVFSLSIEQFTRKSFEFWITKGLQWKAKDFTAWKVSMALS